MDKVKRMQKKKRGIKASLTRSVGELHSLLNADDLDKNIITERIKVIEECLEKYRENKAEILELINDEEIDGFIETETAYEEEIQQVLIKARAATKKTGSKEDAEESAKYQRGERAVTVTASQPFTLPHVEIPKFSGNLIEWLAFIQSFENAVDKSDLPNSVKLTILRNHVTGEALETIAYFTLTEDNYAIALQALRERYGDENRLVDIYVEQLIELKTRAEHLTLRQTYDQLLSIVSILETLKIKRDQYAILLVPMLKAVFAYPVQLKWTKYERVNSSLNENRLSLFLRFLKEEVEILEATKASMSRGKGSDSNAGKQKRNPTAAFQNRTTPPVNPPFRSKSRPTNFTQTGTQQLHRHDNNSIWPNSNQFRNNRPYMYRNQSQSQYRTQSNMMPASSKEHEQSTGQRGIPCPPPCCFCKAKTGQNMNHHPRSCNFATEFDPVRVRELVTRDRRCVRCLGARPSTLCQCTLKCFICKNSHHTLLCERRTQTQVYSSDETEVKTFNSATLKQKHSKPHRSTLLPTASAYATGRYKHHTRLLLDSGSERSYITRTLANRIQAPIIRYEYIGSEVFGGKKESPKNKEIASISLSSRNNDEHRSIDVEVLVIDEITSSKFTQTNSIDIHDYQHLCEIEFADDNKFEFDQIGVLIGQDHFWDVVEGDIRKGDRGEPVALNTIFGYVLSGPFPSIQGNKEPCSFLCRNNSLCVDLDKFWSIEHLGISSDEKSNHERAVTSYMKTVSFKDGQYEVGLPWKADHPILIDNRDKAFVRLQKLNHKLDSQPDLFNTYNQAIQELIDEKFVEDVTTSTSQTAGNVFYLPHRPVVKEGPSTYKCRPVFDASAEDMNGTSLNDCLLTGPSLIPQILTILLKFRWWKEGLIGDIKRAFLQIGIAEQDRDALRFLWKDHTYRFRTVPFGLCCSPYLLNQTIRLHLQEFPTTSDREKGLVQEMSQSFYVDDLVTGADVLDDLNYKLNHAHCIMEKAGMSLRNWMCSNERLHQANRKQYDFDDRVKCQVLGLHWNRKDDTLQPKIPVWNLAWEYTKRHILSYLAQVFDPLGLLSPLTIQGKLIIQQLWKESFGWDETITQSLQAITSEFIQNCEKLSHVTFPRGIRSYNDTTSAVLKVYCDASTKASAAAVYISHTDKGQLVVSKVKVAPLNSKTMSIPRLELIACLIGARLAKTVREIDVFQELPIFFYTDSAVALAWIKAGEGNKTQRELFINNRVKEILLTTKRTDWNFIQSNQNPADLMTRENSVNKLLSQEGLELWLHGPKGNLSQDTLTCNEAEASILTTRNNGVPRSNDRTDNSICNVAFEKPICILTTRVDGKTQVSDELLLDPLRYSNLRTILRITAYIMRFRNRLTTLESIHMGTVTTSNKMKVPIPSATELERAKEHWLKKIQHRHFHTEIECLKKKQEITRTSKLHSLKPLLTEDGILISIGRSHVTHPVILPQTEPFTNMIIKEIHEQNFHSGVNFTLCQLRQKYWIVRGRQTVKRIIHECLICKRHRAKPYRQVPAALPTWRVTEQTPFQTVGMDFCGPLYVSEGKAYVMIFSCAVTRACHLELTRDMSTTSAIQGLRRMTSRRGISSMIVCDNARSFQKLKESLQSDTKFYFIPPHAPWFGGFYERLNSSIKTALKKCLGKAQLNFEELRTIIVEVENFINHRPITHVTDDIGDPLPLRPVDFLLVSGPTNERDSSSTREKLILRFKHQKTVLASVWNQWKKQYLHQLHKWNEHKIRCSDKTPKIGDVVLVDPFTVTNRALFPLGKIIKVIPGNDSVIRSVVVKMTNGTLRRSTRHVYPLETEGETLEQTQVSELQATEDSTQASIISPIPKDDRPTSTDVLPSLPVRHPSRPRRTIHKPQRLDL